MIVLKSQLPCDTIKFVILKLDPKAALAITIMRKTIGQLQDVLSTTSVGKVMLPFYALYSDDEIYRGIEDYSSWDNARQLIDTLFKECELLPGVNYITSHWHTIYLNKEQEERLSVLIEENPEIDIIHDYVFVKPTLLIFDVDFDDDDSNEDTYGGMITMNEDKLIEAVNQ